MLRRGREGRGGRGEEGRGGGERKGGREGVIRLEEARRRYSSVYSGKRELTGARGTHHMVSIGLQRQCEQPTDSNGCEVAPRGRADGGSLWTKREADWFFYSV